MIGLDSAKLQELALLAAKLRKIALETIHHVNSGHVGGSFSCIEILTALYFGKMNVRPDDPHWADRDRFVLSKGHVTPALYAVLAEKGFFPKEYLKGFRQLDSILSGHAEMKVPGVDFSTGSLGQGLAGAAGMALAARIDKKAYKVYALLGDGEVQEGEFWEAAMASGHYRLNNLIAIVDNNGIQLDGTLEEVMNIEPLDKKFEAFGWNVSIVNGHSIEELLAALEKADSSDKPTAIIAKTVKGKGVSFMENKSEWHGKTPDRAQCALAFAELDARISALEVNGK
jgi:transketolase